ncbi:ATP-dependent DNA helicase RecQ family protein [Dictyostelium discoideum AX4]|uniref:ATP-dependent DNA helicase n=1 Tax=Dictyostelium discoideum TaxID=44689 RepID=Q55A06_DICDI|nr:ATP-dependent DNA helicase RecQ family protein [Dictyostelium discoideum AX4]EAL71344.2 ATP-dependent DNA helicase RecQ family protein [Dictyostelium discoideum AX4]|eukprot:XP_645178.2 ATP-dependent DNA helicase RecQ family protein [Dictyostelium discoideum AX4]
MDNRPMNKLISRSIFNKTNERSTLSLFQSLNYYYKRDFTSEINKTNNNFDNCQNNEEGYNVINNNKKNKNNSNNNNVEYNENDNSNNNNNNNKNEINNNEIDFDWSMKAKKKIKKSVLTGEDRLDKKTKDLKYLNSIGLLVKLKSTTISNNEISDNSNNNNLKDKENDEIETIALIDEDNEISTIKKKKKIKTNKNSYDDDNIDNESNDYTTTIIQNEDHNTFSSTTTTTRGSIKNKRNKSLKKEEIQKQHEENQDNNHDKISIEYDENELKKTYNLDENGDNIVEMSPAFKNNNLLIKKSKNKKTKQSNIDIDNDNDNVDNYIDNDDDDETIDKPKKSKSKSTTKSKKINVKKQDDENEEEEEDEDEEKEFKSIEISKLKKKKKEIKDGEYLNIKNVYKEWLESPIVIKLSNDDSCFTNSKIKINPKSFTIKSDDDDDGNGNGNGNGNDNDKNNLKLKREWHELVETCNRDIFGNKEFRNLQIEAINSILHDRDTFVSLPTGGGKSLCFQIPSIVDHRGVTFVISPLLALMQDQVHKLKSLGIPAESINSSGSQRENRDVLDQLLNGETCKLKLIYITPERLAQSEFLHLLDQLYDQGRLRRLVVDEAHCISEWGHSFRPKYRLISTFRDRFPSVPISAFTASATPNVEIDIKNSLKMVNPITINSSFLRPNLLYQVRQKQSDEESLLKDIYNFISFKYPNSTGIIYCATVRECEIVADYLSERGLSSNFYHAKLSNTQRSKLQKDWTNGEFKIVCTTIAFGMGIDKGDTRFVIHHSMPQSMESYYQQTGRAGRDGKHSDCLLFYNKSDLMRFKHIISLNQPKDPFNAFSNYNGVGIGDIGGEHLILDNDGNYISNYSSDESQYMDTIKNKIQQTSTKLEMLDSVASFCSTQSKCRRVTLLNYFGENSKSCGNMCDICISNSNSNSNNRSKAKQNQIDYSERIYNRNSYSISSFKNKKKKSHVSYDNDNDVD